MGDTDVLAYTRAMNSINASNRKVVDFLERGRAKVIDYYDANYPSILTKARQAMKSRNYDEALFYATSRPSCSRGYAEASALVQKISGESLDYNGARLLAKARAAWAAHPDEQGAAEAHSYLSQIDPGASCMSQTNALAADISKTVKRNWEFENIQKHKDAVALEKERIKAARDASIAWAKSRPRVVNRYYWVWR